jgi:hypothetical protein
VAAAAAAAAKLPPPAATVGTKTPVATAMAGAQMITNNQLKAAAATAAEMATMTVEDNAKGPKLANARLSEKGGFAAKVPACNIQEIPGHAAKVAARNIQEIPGHQSRVTYKKYLHRVDVCTPPVEQN